MGNTIGQAAYGEGGQKSLADLFSARRTRERVCYVQMSFRGRGVVDALGVKIVRSLFFFPPCASVAVPTVFFCPSNLCFGSVCCGRTRSAT